MLIAPPGGDLAPGPVTVTPDPGLLSAQPEMMLTAAGSYERSAHAVHSVAQATTSVASQLVADWKGKGADGFHRQMGMLSANAPTAAEALMGTAVALRSLASQITEAQGLARQAIALAGQTSDESNALNNAFASTVQDNLAQLPANPTGAQVTQATTPTASQTAQAQALAADGAAAQHMMQQANALAQEAWRRAAAGFDSVSAQAPSVRAAVAAAQAKAKAAKAHQGGGILGGIINLGGAIGLGIVDGVADVATDGAATPLDEADAGEIADMAESGATDLTGGSASASEVAAAEEAAAANTEVDGTKLDSQIVADEAGGVEPDAAYHYTFQQWQDAIEAEGLRPGTYATPDGDLSPLQAQLDLSLPPNRGLPEIRIQIDVAGLRDAGYDIPEISRVSNVVKASDGRVYTMPGGGYEMRFPYEIPPEYIKVMQLKP